ncbi:hypothetical protein Vafri_12147 [Volvox africanus]|uniref:Uncharacterized protein n=1 Tax=Volvox africanus TaxID=51714 RepID=A0A8J4B9E9_9CHLO|nr:hypothetical protein Vafri_12147 [Volvox africanus]
MDTTAAVAAAAAAAEAVIDAGAGSPAAPSHASREVAAGPSSCSIRPIASGNVSKQATYCQNSIAATSSSVLPKMVAMLCTSTAVGVACMTSMTSIARGSTPGIRPVEGNANK